MKYSVTRMLKLACIVCLLAATPQFARASSEGPGLNGEEMAAAQAEMSVEDQNLAEPRPNGLSATFSYFTVSGVAFQPRTSSLTYAYAGVGCIKRASGSDFFVANLPLPDGAQIKYLRLYTYDTATSNISSAYITRYNRQGGFTDLASVTSPSGTGYRTFLSAEITENVDTSLYSYVVNWSPTNNNTALCGVRVAYYEPVLYGSFLPFIRR